LYSPQAVLALSHRLATGQVSSEISLTEATTTKDSPLVFAVNFLNVYEEFRYTDMFNVRFMSKTDAALVKLGKALKSVDNKKRKRNSKGDAVEETQMSDSASYEAASRESVLADTHRSAWDDAHEAELAQVLPGVPMEELRPAFILHLVELMASDIVSVDRKSGSLFLTFSIGSGGRLSVV
jgi:hypothetical protein